MGMYTELFLSCRVRRNTEAIPILKYLANKELTPGVLPKHDVFSCPRWEMLGRCSSYYFLPKAYTTLDYDDIGKYWMFVSLSSLKNYNNEIQIFIDWLRPFLEVDQDEMFGYYRYEENKEPTILYGEARA